MNQFIIQFDDLNEDKPITADQELELLDHILQESQFIDSLDYAKLSISSLDALDIVAADESILPDVVDTIAWSYEHVAFTIAEHPEQFAYHLAFHNPELATQLLNELLYYRSVGRV